MLRYSSGSSSTEYVLTTLVVVMTLFAPVFDGGQSLAGLLISSIKDYSNSTSYLLSLP